MYSGPGRRRRPATENPPTSVVLLDWPHPEDPMRPFGRPMILIAVLVVSDPEQCLVKWAAEALEGLADSIETGTPSVAEKMPSAQESLSHASS